MIIGICDDEGKILHFVTFRNKIDLSNIAAVATIVAMVSDELKVVERMQEEGKLPKIDLTKIPKPDVDGNVNWGTHNTN